jgi:UDP-N-acetylglucosamine 2-epimerase (non-hydrolysing)
MPQIEASDILTRMGLEKEKYFVVSAHREENISSDKNFFGLLESLNQIAEKYNYPIIVSTHPRTKKRLESLVTNHESPINIHSLIQWQKPMGFSDYNALQLNSFAVLSDSGTISEESSTMNFRALNIRDAHERPEAMEEASVMMVGLNPERILQGLEQLKLQKTGIERNFRKVNDYSMPNVSEKVVRIILSYTSYIKRVVWSE